MTHSTPEIANPKYPLAGKHSDNAVGFSDLKESNGLLIDTNGCTVLLVTAGCAVAEINFRRHALSRGDAVFLFNDDVFILCESSTRFSVQFVSVAYEIVEDVFCTLTSVSFWDLLYENPVLPTNERQRSLLDAWRRQMEWVILTKESPYRDDMLHSGMLNLFMAIHAEMIASGYEPTFTDRNRGWLLAMKFWKLLVRHCREHHDVHYYAARLCITPTYLYKLTRKVMHASPKEVIDQQIVSQIKTALANTDRSVGQIAADFRFDDVSYFCRFFRRRTGLSPVAFRNGLRK